MVQLLADNLVSTPQSLGDPKKEAAEDVQVSRLKYRGSTSAACAWRFPLAACCTIGAQVYDVLCCPGHRQAASQVMSHLSALQDRHERVLASTCSAAGALLELLFPSGAAAALPAVEEGREGDTSGSGKGNGQASVLEGIGAMLRQPALFKGEPIICLDAWGTVLRHSRPCWQRLLLGRPEGAEPPGCSALLTIALGPRLTGPVLRLLQASCRPRRLWCGARATRW